MQLNVSSVKGLQNFQNISNIFKVGFTNFDHCKDYWLFLCLSLVVKFEETNVTLRLIFPNPVKVKDQDSCFLKGLYSLLATGYILV